MNCSYCTAEIEKGTGMMFVRRNGTVRHYCSQRCYKFNILMNRRPNRKEIEERASRK